MYPCGLTLIRVGEENEYPMNDQADVSLLGCLWWMDFEGKRIGFCVQLDKNEVLSRASLLWANKHNVADLERLLGM